jgi:hypothetical protein
MPCPCRYFIILYNLMFVTSLWLYLERYYEIFLLETKWRGWGGGGKKLGPQQEDMSLNPLNQLGELTQAFKILWVRSLQVVTPTWSLHAWHVAHILSEVAERMLLGQWARHWQTHLPDAIADKLLYTHGCKCSTKWNLRELRSKACCNSAILIG